MRRRSDGEVVRNMKTILPSLVLLAVACGYGVRKSRSLRRSSGVPHGLSDRHEQQQVTIPRDT